MFKRFNIRCTRINWYKNETHKNVFGHENINGIGGLFFFFF